MHRRTGLAALVVCGSLAGSAVHAETPGPSPEIEAAADDILALINAVLEHHFRPPTKQEMVLEAVRELARMTTAKLPDDAELARAVSSATSDDALREIIRSACGTLRDSNSPATTETYVLIAGEGVFHCVPFGGSVTTVKRQGVDEQFAANRYVGIGIALSTGEKDPHRPAIAAVLPGGPCDAAGIPQGTHFLEVDGWSTEGQSLEELVDRLRGPEGTEVKLLMQYPDENEPRRVTLKRGVVPMKSVTMSEPNGERRAVVSLRIGRLSSSVPQELRELAARMEKPRKMRLDLSSVDQGTVHNAILIADELLDSGVIGYVEEGGRRRKVDAQPGALFEGFRLVVVVGPNTHGPAEWLAQALIENGRATAVGEPSAGSAVGMTPHTLPGGRMVAQIPTQKLLSPSAKPLLASADEASMQQLEIVRADRSESGRIVPKSPREEGLQELLLHRNRKSPDLLYEFLKSLSGPGASQTQKPSPP